VSLVGRARWTVSCPNPRAHTGKEIAVAADTLPLAGIRVLDLTRARAGPTAVRQLADWGADAIKIEAPTSDDGAAVMASGRHHFDFVNLHRNKRSLALDLKSDEGRELFLRLCESADVVVENYRPGVKHRLGIDYEAARARNPRIVYGSISGFGQDGPYRDRPGVDQIAQGLGGLMSITGLPGQGPVRVGIPIADLSAGLMLAIGILLALYERERTGVGRWVHTSLLEAQIAMLDFQAARWLIAGEVAPQAGNNHPTGIPTGVFPTSDGHINIAAAGNVMYRRMCETLGAPELIEHPDYRSNGRRLANRDALNEEIAALTRTRSSEEWVVALNKAGVPCGPINRIDQTFADPQVRHLAMGSPVEHPALGRVDVVGQALHVDGVPYRTRRPSPELGEHSAEILAEIGVTAEQVAALRERGVL
jgi:crotonobetainyl-CoA:carnitine CoA-transferase CaiB-like acyl-CoA transferase